MWIHVLGLLSYYNSKRFKVAGVRKKLHVCNIYFENIKFCFININMLMAVSTFI